MKIGFLGAGGIAETVAPTVAAIADAECWAVAARSEERARAFAQKHGFARAYGSYEQLVCDPEVELIYIATPHSLHFEHMMLCMEHGKPVLCEKAFTMNAAQAQQVRTFAEKHHVFAAEAIWTRYMPSRAAIQRILDSGIIGRVYTLTANLSYTISHVERLVKPELAGGALLDVGVYGVNFALMHFGTEIDHIESSVQMTPSGVDGMESITIFYRDGRMAVLTHGIYARSDRKGIFYGEKGYMVVENINNPQSVSVFDTNDQLIQRETFPGQISGYEYQFQECMQAVRAQKIESSSMPLAESVRVMQLLDGLRRQWGLVYPQERQ